MSNERKILKKSSIEFYIILKWDFGLLCLLIWRVYQNFSKHILQLFFGTTTARINFNQGHRPSICQVHWDRNSDTHSCRDVQEMSSEARLGLKLTGTGLLRLKTFAFVASSLSRLSSLIRTGSWSCPSEKSSSNSSWLEEKWLGFSVIEPKFGSSLIELKLRSSVSDESVVFNSDIFWMTIWAWMASWRGKQTYKRFKRHILRAYAGSHFKETFHYHSRLFKEVKQLRPCFSTVPKSNENVMIMCYENLKSASQCL